MEQKDYLSWSSYSCFKWSREEYYKRYILGEKGIVTEEMEFGKKFAEGLEKETTDDMEIEMARLMMPSYPKKEYKLIVEFDGVKLLSIFDQFCPKKLNLGEVKTGKLWTQKRADEHGQLKFYNLVVWREYEKIANEILLHSWETGRTDKGKIVLTGKYESFRVNHSLADLLQFFVDVKRVDKEVKMMWENYNKNELHKL